jgi:hypothetical protein
MPIAELDAIAAKMTRVILAPAPFTLIYLAALKTRTPACLASWCWEAHALSHAAVTIGSCVKVQFYEADAFDRESGTHLAATASSTSPCKPR